MSATACNFKNPRIQVICSVSALCTQRGVRFDCTDVPFICTVLHSLHDFKNKTRIRYIQVNSGQNADMSSAANTVLSMRNLPPSSTVFKMFFGIKVKPVIDQDIHTCTTQITTSSNFTFKTSTNHQKDTKLLISSTDHSFTMADISQRTLMLCSINITQSN